MLTFFDPIRDINLVAVILRLTLAAICGGIIGAERAISRSPAGLRTHILICLGAAMTTLTSQYMFFYLHLYTDIARLGAQVVAGVGFIGTGTIIITQKHQIKGLTTAAGIWAASIIGLVLGAGFYEGGILATFLLIFVRFTAPKLQSFFADQSNDRIFYIEYKMTQTLNHLISTIRDYNIDIKSLETAKTKRSGRVYSESCAIISVRFKSKSTLTPEQLEDLINNHSNVVFVKELG